MVLAQISIAPVGKDVSLSKYVKIVLNTFRENNIKFEINAMATVIETKNLDTLFNVVKKAHLEVLKTGVRRVITEIKIDDRLDKKASIKSKIDSVNS